MIFKIIIKRGENASSWPPFYTSSLSAFGNTDFPRNISSFTLQIYSGSDFTQITTSGFCYFLIQQLFVDCILFAKGYSVNNTNKIYSRAMNNTDRVSDATKTKTAKNK